MHSLTFLKRTKKGRMSSNLISKLGVGANSGHQEVLDFEGGLTEGYKSFWSKCNLYFLSTVESI